MTSPGAAQRVGVHSPPRRVRLVLRDDAVVEGGLFLNEGQALAPYLGSRKGGWVNIINAVWLAEGETHNHAVLQADHILLASSPDKDIPVHGGATGATAREVAIGLADGSQVEGVLHLAEKQRLSDYLHSCGKFMPVIEAKRLPAGEELGEVALNCGAVRVVRDRKLFAPGSMDLAAEAGAEIGGVRRSSVMMNAPVNREEVMRETGSVEVLTEGRVPDRRAGRPYTPPAAQAPLPAPAVPELTSEQRQLAERVARHWLVQLGAGVQLSPPDPRELSPAPTLEEIWSGLARSNDMAEGELAVHVASAFKLPVANLEQVTPEALHAVPAKVARKLGVLPLQVDHRFLDVALSDPSSVEIEQQLAFVTRLTLRFTVAPPSEIRAALDRHYGGAPGAKATR